MACNKLTKREEAVVKEFKERLGNDVINKMDDFQKHPVNMMRWIRARELNLNNAEEMLKKSLKWRKDNGVDEILQQEMPQEMLDELPFQIVGHDKDGCIACAVPFGKWDLKKIIESGKQKDFFKVITRLLELGQTYMRLNSTDDLLLTQFVLVLDFEGFAYRQIMSTQAISALLELLRLFEANYPETLKAAYVINAPRIFELFFTLVRPILSQRTLSKISIFGSNQRQWRSALTMNIDAKNLPANFGGTNCAHPFYHPSHGMEWFPRARVFQVDEFHTKNIAAGDKFVLNYDLYAGDRLTFNFRTETHDIGFQFLLNNMPLYPYAKADSHLHMQDGLVDCVIDGTYSLVFDNTYSRFTGKTLMYAVQVENKGEFTK